ncbi:aldo/keto reductase [Desulfopila sp. IMCC35008]|uniref:aldo/keto reductase n=1 Tax=Desulfopila sp. IMCC35008 TaxID=2653858 RepID=UPI0013D01225|nr:aldo/keto reductase [Desulfopila sp. IMCC35008]
MLYRKIPKSGDKLSILGFGCMRLPLFEDGSINTERAIRQIRVAIDAGVNYLDTAWPYHTGESEKLVGLALAEGYREKVRIATKLPSWMINCREDMDFYLNAQLEKLAVSQVDYYLVHALNGTNWQKLQDLGVTEFLNTALADGRIKNTGFSFHGELSDFRTIVDSYSWDMCQIQYNYLDQEYQAGTEGLKYAAEKKLGIVIMEPLRGGNLSIPEPPPAIAEIWQQAEIKRTPVEWALRWLWNHPEVTVILSGMNDEAHIEENLAIADTAEIDSLTEKEYEIVDQAARKYNELMKVGCTGCGYCLPCPSGVKIPMVFEVYNKMHLFGNEMEGKLMYVIRLSGSISGDGAGYASQCTECGECLEKCPQNIEIPTMLTEITAEMEDDKMAERQAFGRKILAME